MQLQDTGRRVIAIALLVLLATCAWGKEKKEEKEYPQWVNIRKLATTCSNPYRSICKKIEGRWHDTFGLEIVPVQEAGIRTLWINVEIAHRGQDVCLVHFSFMRQALYYRAKRPTWVASAFGSSVGTTCSEAMNRAPVFIEQIRKIVAAEQGISA